jgi:ERCC4-type nuclease
MNIIIDERERALHQLFTSENILVQTIPLGDIILQYDNTPFIIIERKTIPDLLSSISDGRYKEQSYRLKHASNLQLHRIIYLIEGQINTLNDNDKHLVYSIISSLNQVKGFSVLQTVNIEETKTLILVLYKQLDRAITSGKLSISNQPSEIVTPNYCTTVKKQKIENITPDNIGEIFLMQIPNVSYSTAIAVMSQFSSFNQLLIDLKANPNCLDNIMIDCNNGKPRRIARKAIDSIKEFLLR